jgi:hypothetical protein
MIAVYHRGTTREYRERGQESHFALHSQGGEYWATS